MDKWLYNYTWPGNWSGHWLYNYSGQVLIQPLVHSKQWLATVIIQPLVHNYWPAPGALVVITVARCLEWTSGCIITVARCLEWTSGCIITVARCLEWTSGCIITLVLGVDKWLYNYSG